MNPQDLPKGPGSGEMASLDGRKPVNAPGVYRHEAAGKEIIVMPDIKSTALQDALVRQGWVKIAEAPSRQDLLKMQAAQAKADAKAEKDGVDPTAIQSLAPEADKVVYNGTATDVNAQLAAALERATNAEAALEAVNQEATKAAEKKAAKDAEAKIKNEGK